MGGTRPMWIRGRGKSCCEELRREVRGGASGPGDEVAAFEAEATGEDGGEALQAFHTAGLNGPGGTTCEDEHEDGGAFAGVLDFHALDPGEGDVPSEPRDVERAAEPGAEAAPEHPQEEP